MAAIIHHTLRIITKSQHIKCLIWIRGRFRSSLSECVEVSDKLMEGRHSYQTGNTSYKGFSWHSRSIYILYVANGPHPSMQSKEVIAYQVKSGLLFKNLNTDVLWNFCFPIGEPWPLNFNTTVVRYARYMFTEFLQSLFNVAHLLIIFS